MSISIKPLVTYVPRTLVLYRGNPSGIRATLVPEDHPDTQNVVNGEYAHTSTIKSIDAVTGVFETKNTVYRPAYAPAEPLIIPDAE